MSDEISQVELAEIEALVGPAVPTPLAMRSGYDAASIFDKTLAMWQPSNGSADFDMLDGKDRIDARARDLSRNDAYVQGGANVHKDSIVGAFYMLNSKPDWKVLGFDSAWAEEFQQEVEAKFTLWAESPHHWVDASRMNDFTGLVRLAVGVYVFQGESLATAEWVQQGAREYRTAIQMVDTDRLSTPMTMQFDPMIRGGLRLDNYGAPISAFIRVQHPMDYNMWNNQTNMIWKEVPWRKPWGRSQVIYAREQMRVDQTRAVSEIAAGLREIAITRQFRDVTLQKAVMAASYAATIESELPPEAVYAQLGGSSAADDAAKAMTTWATDWLTAISKYSSNAKNLTIDGARIPHLFPGTKLNMLNVGDPAGVGQEFEASLLRYVATALGISYEELSRDFSKSNYSSARAAMLNTWKFMQSRKRVVADYFASSVFRLWLEEAINTGQLVSFPKRRSAMLYTNGYQNTMFEALSRCDWIGASRGQIDELKETQAAVLRMKYGLSTSEDELARLGKDWRKVYEQLAREQADREAKKLTFAQDNTTNTMNAVSGTPRDKTAA
jgi:lambda family phage portal protein